MTDAKDLGPGATPPTGLTTHISDGIILGATSATVYLAAFTRELGYARWFRIPNGLIEITLTHIVLAAALCILTGMLFLSLYAVVSLLIPAVNRSPVAFPLLGTAVLFMLFTSWDKWSFLGTVVVLIYALLVASLEFSKSEDSRPIPRHWVPVVTTYRVHVLAVYWALLIVAVSFATGRGGAWRREEFYVVHGSPDRVVLRIYGDRVIAAEVDRKARTIVPRFHVWDAKGDSAPVLVLEHIGRLTALDSVPRLQRQQQAAKPQVAGPSPGKQTASDTSTRPAAVPAQRPSPTPDQREKSTARPRRRSADRVP